MFLSKLFFSISKQIRKENARKIITPNDPHNFNLNQDMLSSLGVEPTKTCPQLPIAFALPKKPNMTFSKSPCSIGKNTSSFKWRLGDNADFFLHVSNLHITDAVCQPHVG